MHGLRTLALCSAAITGLMATTVQAKVVNVTVTVENLAPTNSVSFAPLHFGFNNGSFDAFNNGEVATAPIISVAEGGSASAWLPAFAAADPTAVLGSTGAPILPGAMMTTGSFRVDTAINPFFTFASMVIPSNDLFIGNDNPMRYRLFDASGNLLIGSILQDVGAIWDAGSEAVDPANAAFIVGGNNDLRTPENGVVSFEFSELSAFQGLQTAAGYTFDGSQLDTATPVFRISFSAVAVPEPGTWAMMILGFGVIGSAMRSAKRQAKRPQLAR